MRPYALAAIAPLLASCITVSEQPLGSETVQGDYHRVALCVNEYWEKDGFETRVIENRADRWTRVTGGITSWGHAMVWDTTFRAAGPNMTAVEVKAQNTVRGSDFWPNRIIGVARDCSRTIARR